MSLVPQKSQYSLRAVFELAKHQGQEPVKIQAIAEAQDIPQRFLENILSQLRQSGIVASRRGKHGGYLLVRERARLSVGEVLRLVQGPISIVDCSGNDGDVTCSFGRDCVFWPMWRKAQTALDDIYDNISFQDLVDQEEKLIAKQAVDYTI